MNITEILQKHRLRATHPRSAVFQALQSHHEAIDIATLIRACPEVDRVTIYRTLEVFHQLGIIEVVHIGWKKRYELAAPHKPHHHHLHCTNCGQLIDIDSPQLENFITELTKTHNFLPQSHTFEVNGTCQDCQQHK